MPKLSQQPQGFPRVDELMGEVERYLRAIELFRGLGHEPNWRSELGSVAARTADAALDRAR
jgi:hypothetical protein